MHVGEPVGEQQDLSGAGSVRGAQGLHSLQPAAGEVRAAAREDAADDLEQGLAGVAHRDERGEELDLVVVGDQGELVGRGEPPDQERRALLGGLELRPGHGPGAVDDQGEVERRPLVCGGRRRRDQLEHGVDAVLALHGEQLVFQSD